MTDQFRTVADGRFLEYRPTGEDLKCAAERSEQMGVLPNSFTRGSGRMVGMLGEIAVENFLDGLVTNCGDTVMSYDLVAENGTTVEVKSKRARSIPKLEYAASVEKKRNHMFKNDLFAFVRVHDSMAKLWLLGWITTESFRLKSVFKKAGEPESGSGFAYRMDGYHIPLNKLRKMQTLRRHLRSG